jgi:hypothetical protein
MVEWIREPACAIAFDSRWHPAVISSWYGTPSVSLIDGYFRWSDAQTAAAIASEQRWIHVVDLTHAQIPAAAARKRAFEHIRNDPGGEVKLLSIVVLDNPGFVGILTALRWLAGGPRELEVVAVRSMPDALGLALERLRAERIPAPVGLDPVHYQPPRKG